MIEIYRSLTGELIHTIENEEELIRYYKSADAIYTLYNNLNVIVLCTLLDISECYSITYHRNIGLYKKLYEHKQGIHQITYSLDFIRQCGGYYKYNEDYKCELIDCGYVNLELTTIEDFNQDHEKFIYLSLPIRSDKKFINIGDNSNFLMSFDGELLDNRSICSEVRDLSFYFEGDSLYSHPYSDHQKIKHKLNTKCYLENELRLNDNFMKKAIKLNCGLFEYASETVRSDIKFVESLFKRFGFLYGFIILHMSDELLNSKKISNICNEEWIDNLLIV